LCSQQHASAPTPNPANQCLVIALYSESWQCSFPYITLGQMTFDKEKQECLSRRYARWFGPVPVFHTSHTTDFLQNNPKLRCLQTRYVSNNGRDTGRCVTSDGTHTASYTTDGRSFNSSWCWSLRQLLFCHQVASPAMQDGCHLSKVFVSICRVFTILHTHTHTHTWWHHHVTTTVCKTHRASNSPALCSTLLSPFCTLQLIALYIQRRLSHFQRS